MKIDLHCHTKKVKTGDSSGRNVNVELFKRKVEEADVRILAITNHNCFDLEQYENFKKAVREFCQIWPGIELDIHGEKGRGHLIVIANPNNYQEFSNKIEDLIRGESPDKFLVDVQTVFEIVDDCDVIYIPHFHKEPRLSDKDIDKLNVLLKDKSRLFKETSDYRSLGVYSNFDYSMIIGSDVQDWSRYEQSNFADIRLPVNTFEQFCLLAKKDKQIINTLLNKKKCSRILVSPHSNVKIEVPIYEDVNIIFGQKGTGKSEIINSLSRYYKEKSIAFSEYIGGSKEKDFDKLLDASDMQHDMKVFNKDNGKASFKFICDWVDELPTSFESYVNWMKTKDNNRNKSRMGITDAVNVQKIKADKQLKTDYKNTQEYIESDFCNMQLDKYLSQDEIDIYRQTQNLLFNRIYTAMNNDWQERNVIKLTNFSIEHIKKIADKCSDTVSKPSSIGFVAFAEKRILLYEEICSLEKNVVPSEKTKKELIGTLEEKGDIYVQHRYRMFDDKKSNKEEFNVGITKLRSWMKLLKMMKKQCFTNEIFSQLEEFKDLCEKGIDSIDVFVGASKQIVLEDGASYRPSSGEKGILLLEKLLDDDSDAYLLDEPELGMGNSYINSSILPKIIGLAKQHKTVVIATHNANIAVRTLPYISIFRNHINGVYNTYIGNPFCDDLVNVNDKLDIINWTKESMHTLEGGEEAFYERKDIYESGRSSD